MLCLITVTSVNTNFDKISHAPFHLKITSSSDLTSLQSLLVYTI